jgi:hypothetical protein
VSSSNKLAAAKSFLQELANLSDDPKAVTRFERRFAPFLPWAGQQTQPRTVPFDSVDSGEPASSILTIDLSNDRLFSLRNKLRSVWATSDLKEKEWRIFLLRADSTMTVSFLSSLEVPAPSPFEQTVMYLFKRASKTRCCHNRECHSPYFWASRSSQKYCSDVCALPAQRSYKRLWWQKNGEEWKKLRAKKLKRRTKG